MRILPVALALLAGCASTVAPAPTPSPSPAPAPPATATLVESTPLETSIATPGVPEAADVWLQMVRGARRSIDLAEFYVSDAPGSRLHEILAEIERAAARGVHVRLLVDELFYAKYPEVPDAWKALPNMEVHRLDLKPGVLHAKYFVVDGRDAYLGSQNFDYRSLEHIFEIGVHTDSPAVATRLERVFESDWSHTPLHLDSTPPGDLTLKVSPQSLAGGDANWDLPVLLKRIASAQKEICAEVLTYKTKNRDGSSFTEIDDALRAAAARKVAVKFVVSTWGEGDESVNALAAVPGIDVKVIPVARHSSGEIPFARVAHAKYAVFDGERSWIGTSNWEGDYFYKSRNVSLFVEGGEVTKTARRVFQHVSELTRPLAAR